ncbi:hypothetical protein RclHR1_00010014 [Rhizophagus clarus]|uniref:F-box domain-containing protein n=1 Tax=Rhizophagus clarus TaxID=94130 RepID=A0A2Z6Q4Q9_9GLOM|nr:hypothetical protein RclHR1_00010014 [Rhizophagus clarus]GES75197.1 hypothetical protein GLOIN_2v1761505 [Rhizophagus clarus]
MSKLIRDIIYLILQELQDDKVSLYSCLTVNKTWSEIVIPIIWKNPWKYLGKGNENLLLNTIIKHLPDESKDNLSKYFKMSSYQKPLFNYISYCKHLNLDEIDRLLFFKSSIINIDEIFKLFINENMKFTHLYIPQKCNHSLHHISGADKCFSKLEFLSCNTNINDDVLSGLVEICKSIKALDLFVEPYQNNYGIIKLIESPKKLIKIRFLTKPYSPNDETFCGIVENSFIKHSKHLKYFKITKQPSTKILSSFKNLKYLELHDNSRPMTWNCLENLSLPYLQVLRATGIPIKVLTSLIENTNGYLIEIKIDHISHNEFSNKKIIQTIYKNCPKLEYLKLLFINNNVLELRDLLINCKYLIGLYIIFEDVWDINVMIDYNNIFNILTDLSPISLFKFKFYYHREPDLKSFELFFDNWKTRNPMIPMLLQTIQYHVLFGNEHFDLIEDYIEKGIVKNYYNVLSENTFEDFEWS